MVIHKRKLLWLSDQGNGTTGYGSVTKNILNRLKPKFWDCTNIAHNYGGCDLIPPINLPDNEILNFKIISGGRNPYGQDMIESLIIKEKPDVFGILLDTFMCMPWLLSKQLAAPSFFYFPSDGEGSYDAVDKYGGLPYSYGMSCAEILKKVNLPIAMSKFGQIQVQENHGVPCHYIPHGVDLKTFYPYDAEGRARAKESFGLPSNALVIGDNFRNSNRKVGDRKLLVFREFLRKYNNKAYLLLNCDPMDPASYFDIRLLAQQLGILPYIRFTGMQYWDGISMDRLRDFYNAIDFKLDTTSGEGFGLTIIEAMACGTPSVITDFTTTNELIMENGQCGLPVKVVDRILGSHHVFRGIIDVDDGVKQCLEMAHNLTMREEFSKVGVKKVKAHYDYEKIAEEFNVTLRRLANG